jgi:hypothetical protein
LKQEKTPMIRCRVDALICLASVCWILLGTAAHAADHTVPGDFPTIQAAINHAGTVSGDTIVLTAGVYTGAGNIAVNTIGKNLTIRSASDIPDDCLIDCEFTNRALLVLSGETVTVRGITFANGMNPTGNVGGGIYVQNGSLQIENCLVSNCNTRNAVANDFCGGAVAAVTPAQLTIVDSEFVLNSAGSSFSDVGSGAAIYAHGAATDVFVDGCVFSSNETASGIINSQPSGGAIAMWEGASLQMSNSSFEGNESVEGAGGDIIISSGGLHSYTGCSFEGGSAYRGGAIYSQFTPSMQIMSCEFADCQASQQGGAIELSQCGQLDVSETTFENCTSAYAGGVVLYRSGMSMDRCTVRNNTGTIAVAAIWVLDDTNANEVMVTNTLIANNTSPWFGAIAFEDANHADHLIANCTIANNTNSNLATGAAGLQVHNSTLSVVNSILFFNNIQGDQSYGAQLESQGGANLSISYCSIQNLPSELIGMNGTINADPLFLDPTGGDYHLSSNSPCIDAADNFYPDSVPYTLDLDNNGRKSDVSAVLDTGLGAAPIVDMGAYEVSELVCPADIVSTGTFQPPPDGQVDGADLAYLLGEWGPNPGSLADIVDSGTFMPPPDGVVDAADLAFLLGAWGPCE